MASKENIYFLRSFLLLIEGGLYISKEILRRECQKPDTDLDESLQKNKQKLKHSLHVNQYRKLYPESDKADIKSWDLQLSVGVLINVFGRNLKSGEKVKLKLLRDLRNDIYMHCTTAALDESKYEDIIEDLCDIITTLASTFDISVQQRCSNCIKQFTSGPLEAVRPSLQTLNGFSQSYQRTFQVGVQTKMVISGPSKNWITLCEQTLETIFNHAESMTSEDGGFQEIQENVRRMLSYLESNKAAVFKGCERKCIILFFECKDYKSFLNLLHKVECQEYTCYLGDISNSLQSFIKPSNPISITSKVTSECLQSVLIDIIKTSSNEKEERRHIVEISSEENIHDNKTMAPRDVNTEMKLIKQSETTLLLNLELIHCEALPQMLQSFQGKQFSDSLTKVAGSLSRHYGGEITLKASMNVGAVLEALEESVSDDVTLDRETIKSESIYAKTPKENDFLLLPGTLEEVTDQKELEDGKNSKRETESEGSEYNSLGVAKQEAWNVLDTLGETEATAEILSTSAVRKYFDIKHCGHLQVERKKWTFFSKTKWDLKYFMISKGAKHSCKWKFFCFDNTFSSRQEWSIQMSDMESVQEYDNKSDKNFVGIRIIFIAHSPEMILRCDTESNRKVWITNIREAIQEAHSDSTDSGFESGGPVARRCITRDSKRSKRQSNKYHHTIDEIESDIEDDNITEDAKQASVDIVSETKEGDIFKQSDEKSGIKKKTRHYENVLQDGNIRVNIQDDNDKRNGEGGEISSDTLSVPIQVDDDIAELEIRAWQQVNTTTEETYAKEIEPSNTQEAEGAVVMRSLAQSTSFASIKSDQGESVEDSFSMVSIRSHDSQKRNLNDNGSYLKKGQCRDSSSSSGSSGSESTPIDTPARLTENFEENDYLFTENHFDKNIMNGVPIGTFLVQMRTKAMGYRLHVMTPKGVMCFKIYEQDGQLSLYKQFNVSSAVFGSLKAFLKHYNVHWLPKDEYNVRLTRGFKARQTADLL